MAIHWTTESGLQRLLLAASTVLALLLMAGAAHADLVAGWDFSQYSGDGSLDTNNDFTGEGTLAANWSTVGAAPGGGGPDANPFGTMYIDGTNGSTETDFQFGFPAEFAASAGSLNSNINRPVTEGADFPFDTCSAVQPQTNCLPLKMKAIADVDVVFEATLDSRPGFVGDGWFLSFAGNRDADFGTDITVAIEASTDGASYTTIGNQLLTVVDTEFVVDLGGAFDGLSTVFVRLGLTGTDTNLTGANIDNLAISAMVIPEPGTAALLGLGLAGLGGVGRSRRGAARG